MNINSFLEYTGNAIIPTRIRANIRKHLSKAGITTVPYDIFGMMFVITLLTTFVVYTIFINPRLAVGGPVYLFFMTIMFWIALESALILLVIFGYKIYVDVKIYNRTKEIERVLPDFLRLVIVNLNAGMSFDKALWNAVQPEFSVLANEIEIVAKKAMSGKDVEQALKEFAQKYKSETISSSMELIIAGLKGGGEITDLLERVSNNLKESENLKKEIIAAVTGYIIFISLIAIVISPLLFALAFNLLVVIQSIGSKLATSGASGSLLSLGTISIREEDFILFSKIAVGTIAMCSAMIISNLRTGDIKGGIKSIPVYIGLAILIYIGLLNGLSGFFTKLFIS